MYLRASRGATSQRTMRARAASSPVRSPALRRIWGKIHWPRQWHADVDLFRRPQLFGRCERAPEWGHPVAIPSTPDSGTAILREAFPVRRRCQALYPAFETTSHAYINGSAISRSSTIIWNTMQASMAWVAPALLCLAIGDAQLVAKRSPRNLF